MNKNEQDILNIVKEKIEEASVPESLHPEQIEKKLLEKNPAGNTGRKKKKFYFYGGLAAACLVLAAGIYTFGNFQREADKVEEAAEPSSPKEIKTAESYEEIYSYLEAKMEEDVDRGMGIADLFSWGFAGGAEESAEAEGAAIDAAPMEMAKATATASNADYSTTNVRQEGVDEADVVKTDGRYLYTLTNDNHKVAIIDTKEELEEVNYIEYDENQYIEEFYLLPEEQKLILVCSIYENETEDENYNQARMIWDPSISAVITYDVSNVKSPEELGFVTQSGRYTSSRLSDGHVYLFSNYSTGGDIAKDEPELYIPMVGARVMEAEDIYLPKLESGCMYEVITSIDVNQPDEVKDSKAIFTDGGQLYVSNENIYYYETSWAYTDKEEETFIRKVSYKDGKLTAVAQETIDGYINDSFSIDEYEENLRVIVTVGETNSVYVMDEELEIIGSIEGLAEEERVYSARFMGETAYFVTFYETDPLFTVDFSNPKDPKIIGKLKIPGFSDYLHFYGEDKLLGIGMSVDEKTMVTEGVKLTMFDISDKTDVKEEATYVLENVYSTDVSYDYKAALIDVPKNIICFPGYKEGSQNYYIFEYDEKDGFVCKLDEEINGYGNGVTRGVYIKDTLYVVQGNIIEAYSLNTFKKVDDIIL